MKRGVEPPGDTSKRLRYADPFSSAVFLPSMSATTASWTNPSLQAVAMSSSSGHSNIIMEPCDTVPTSLPVTGISLSNPSNNHNGSINVGLNGLTFNSSMLSNNDDTKARQLENIFDDGGRYAVQEPNMTIRRSSHATGMPLPSSTVAGTTSILSGSTSPYISMHAMDQSGLSPSRHIPTSPAGLNFGGVWSPNHSTLSLTAMATQSTSINQNGFNPSSSYMTGGQTNNIEDMYASLPRTPVMSPDSTTTGMPYDTPMSPMSPLSPAFPVTLLPFPPPQSVAMDPSKTNSNGGSQRVPLPSTPMSGSLTPNQSPMRQPCRTIYLGGLPANTDARDILEQIRAHGVIESIRILPERGCAFISFLSAAAAAAFHNDYAGSNSNGVSSPVNGPSSLTRRSLIVNGQEIKVSWGKPSPVPLHVLRAAEEDGATRAVFISALVLEDTESRVRDACEQFGEVEILRWFPDRRIAFVHFTSIADAIRCVAWFRSSSDQWLGRQVGYGRDRCVLVNGALQPDGPSTGLSQLDRMDLGRGAVSQQAHQQLAHQQQQQQQAQQQQRVQQQLLQQHQQTMMAMSAQGLINNNNNNSNNTTTNTTNTIIYPPNAVAAMAYAASARNCTDSFGNVIPADTQLPSVLNSMAFGVSPQLPPTITNAVTAGQSISAQLSTTASSNTANMLSNNNSNSHSTANTNARPMSMSPELTTVTLEQQQQGPNSILSSISWMQANSAAPNNVNHPTNNNAIINNPNTNLFVQTQQTLPTNIQSAVCSPSLAAAQPSSTLKDSMMVLGMNGTDSNCNTPTGTNSGTTILSNPGSPTAMMMLDQPMVPPSPDHRTVYLGNLKRSTTVEDLCNVIRGGALERIRLIPEKRIAFVSFITADSAADFYRRALHPGLVVKHQRLRPGWGRPRPLPAEVMRAVSVGASRNVYLGGLDDARVFTVERLRDDFAEYGEIELVNTLPERQCAFVNFTSVAAAVKAVDAIRGKPGYERVRVNFGKDRCANPPRPELDANAGSVGSPGMSPNVLPISDAWSNNLSDETLYQSSSLPPALGSGELLPSAPSPIMTDHNGLNASLTRMFDKISTTNTTTATTTATTTTTTTDMTTSHKDIDVVDATGEPAQSPPIASNNVVGPLTSPSALSSSQWMTEALFSSQMSMDPDMIHTTNTGTNATSTTHQSQLEIFPPLDMCMLQNTMDVSLFSWGTRGPRSMAVGAERQISGNSKRLNELLLSSNNNSSNNHSSDTIESPLTLPTICDSGINTTTTSNTTMTAITSPTSADVMINTATNPWKHQSSLESRLAGRLW